MRKLIMVLIALLLIGAIGGVYVGKELAEKYSYGEDWMALSDYFGVSGEEAAIILNEERMEEKALIRDGVCYFDMDTVNTYFDEIFYQDSNTGVLLHTDALYTVEVAFGSASYTRVTADGSADASFAGTLPAAICFIEADVVYVAADYLQLFVDFTYEMYECRVKVTMYEGSITTTQATISKNTQVRYRGGIKSEILKEIAQGETVTILEELENWSKVLTADGIIGYVENKRLGNSEEVTTTYEIAAKTEYTSLLMEGKVNLGFHAIGGVGGNDTLAEMLSEATGINVIAPTWFSLSDNEGNFRSFATAEYVTKAHAAGVCVWGVWDNFNYAADTGESVDTTAVLSDTAIRRKLVCSMVETALSLDLDGINVDFEQVSAEAGTHYVQFLRELSAACRSAGLVLSVDNYVPYNYNYYYRPDIQGEILDYVIMMGYDEHYHGSADPGSVASLSYVADGLDKLLSYGVPAEKIINAVPFYTILWKIEGASVSDEYITLNNLDSFMERVGQSAAWDEETSQNYAQWTSGGATYEIWLEDAESIKAKLSVMNARNIGGVAVWRIGYGTAEVWALLNAYVNS